MAVVLTAAVMFTAVATALSLLIYLPALSIVESISPRRARARAAVWFLAIVLPVIGGAVGSGGGVLRVRHDKYGSPHLTAERPHLCSRWLLAMPDAPWRVTIFGVLCGGLILGGLVRFASSGLRAHLMARRFRDARPSDGGAIVVESSARFLATVGLFGPVTVTTSGAREALDPEEFEAALAHESAHASRRDNLVDLVASTCVTFVAFVPTAHLYLRYWRDAVEEGCDQEAAVRCSPEAVAAAMVKLAQAAETEAEGELRDLSTRRRHVGARVERRAEALLAAEPFEGAAQKPDRAVVGTVLFIVGAAVLGLCIAATARQVNDTLYCLAESLLTVLGRP